MNFKRRMSYALSIATVLAVALVSFSAASVSESRSAVGDRVAGKELLTAAGTRTADRVASKAADAAD